MFIEIAMKVYNMMRESGERIGEVLFIYLVSGGRDQMDERSIYDGKINLHNFHVSR
jgi:hypothetical protein